VGVFLKKTRSRRVCFLDLVIGFCCGLLVVFLVCAAISHFAVGRSSLFSSLQLPTPHSFLAHADKGEPTPYAWPDVNSHFGILDIAGFPKDRAFWYQAWWKQDTPLLYLFPHWVSDSGGGGGG
jgi:hypothetical protein